MKRINMLISLVALCVLTMASTSWAIDATLSGDRVKAGDAITVTGSIDPGQELFVVVTTEQMFKAKMPLVQKRKKSSVMAKAAKMPSVTPQFHQFTMW